MELSWKSGLTEAQVLRGNIHFLVELNFNNLQTWVKLNALNKLIEIFAETLVWSN